jgi:hypothetical protein
MLAQVRRKFRVADAEHAKWGQPRFEITVIERYFIATAGHQDCQRSSCCFAPMVSAAAEREFSAERAVGTWDCGISIGF